VGRPSPIFHNLPFREPRGEAAKKRRVPSAGARLRPIFSKCRPEIKLGRFALNRRLQRQDARESGAKRPTVTETVTRTPSRHPRRSPNRPLLSDDQRMPRRSADLNFPPPRLVEPALPISLPAAPPHLSDEMKNFWRTTVADYELEAHHLHVLLCACDAFDRMTEAREAVRRDGMVVQGTRGPRPHPCLGVERDNKALFARLIRELDLDEPTPSPGAYMRPPSLRSNRRR
jgi:hypothetical protein